MGCETMDFRNALCYCFALIFCNYNNEYKETQKIYAFPWGIGCASKKPGVRRTEDTSLFGEPINPQKIVAGMKLAQDPRRIFLRNLTPKKRRSTRTGRRQFARVGKPLGCLLFAKFVTLADSSQSNFGTHTHTATRER